MKELMGSLREWVHKRLLNLMILYLGQEICSCRLSFKGGGVSMRVLSFLRCFPRHLLRITFLYRVLDCMGFVVIL